MAASTFSRVAAASLFFLLSASLFLPTALSLLPAQSSIPLYPLPYGTGYTLTAGAGGPAGWQDVSLMLLSTASGEIVFRTRDGCSSSSSSSTDPAFANGCLGEDMADGSVGTTVSWSLPVDSYGIVCARSAMSQECTRYDLRLGLTASPGSTTAPLQWSTPTLPVILSRFLRPPSPAHAVPNSIPPLFSSFSFPQVRGVVGIAGPSTAAQGSVTPRGTPAAFWRIALPRVTAPAAGSSSPSSLASVRISFGIDLRPPASLYSAPFLPTPRVTDIEAAQGTATRGQGRLYFDGGPDWVSEPSSPPSSNEGGSSVLRWSSPSASGLPTVTIHSLKLCGEAMLAPQRSLAAVIDTASSCLTLPAAVFDAVESWLPLECLSGPVPSMGIGRDDRLCRYLYSSAAQAQNLVTPLPTLELTLSQQDAGVEGASIHLPLASLLLPLSATDIISNRASLESRRQAVPRRAGLLYSDWAPSTPVMCLVRGQEQHARIGSMPLGAMYAQIELRGAVTRVALANKVAFASDNVQCRPKEVCSGMERRKTGVNVCFPPNCGSFLFVETSENGKSCHVDEFFYVVLSFIVILFVVLEAGSLFWAESLSRRVYRSAILLQSSASLGPSSGVGGWFIAVPDDTAGEAAAAAEVAAVADAAAAEARYTSAALEYCAGEADAVAEGAGASGGLMSPSGEADAGAGSSGVRTRANRGASPSHA